MFNKLDENIFSREEKDIFRRLNVIAKDIMYGKGANQKQRKELMESILKIQKDLQEQFQDKFLKMKIEIKTLKDLIKDIANRGK